VKQTAGYSGADIASVLLIFFYKTNGKVCREASMMPIRKKLLEGGGILNQLNDIEKLKCIFFLLLCFSIQKLRWMFQSHKKTF